MNFEVIGKRQVPGADDARPVTAQAARRHAGELGIAPAVRIDDIGAEIAHQATQLDAWPENRAAPRMSTA